MHAGQPWGVFLVEFADEQIYRTALRQILRGLVPSRRKHAGLAAWQHENLLFLCTTRDYGRITFAHFRGGKAGRARLATFGWERGARYARTLLEFNLPALAWPDAHGDRDGWLRAWGAAFDVEPVTREFFRVYREVFEKVEAAVTGITDPERRRLFTQRLFNRLMFIAFIEKKGWLKLGDRTDYLSALWEAWTMKPDADGNFYDARLRLLFFQALNNASDAVSGHARKLEIIQHNLYGVDLDPFAVNIARLRLWLSLAVEYEGEKPPPLPNLDFKIEAGDSLAAPDPLSVFSGQGSLRQQIVVQFQEAKAAYLLAHGEEKKALRARADALRCDLKTWLHSEAPAGAFDWAVEFAEVFLDCGGKRSATPLSDSPDAPAPASPPPGSAASQSGVALRLPPHSTGGFDIIVANPPYVRMELIKPLKPMLRRNFAAVHDERTDLYIYFYARAHELLRPGGVAAFISSNKWLRAGYGEKLRQLLLDAQAFHLVADFGELPVFQTAATFPAIFVWEKTPRANIETAWSVVKDLDACYAEGVQTHIGRVAEHVPAARFGAGNHALPRLELRTSARRWRPAGHGLQNTCMVKFAAASYQG